MPMMFPKAQQVRDEAYLDWCRMRACVFCGKKPPSEAHHTVVKGMGGGKIRDDSAIPVCQRCHMRCHGQTVEGKPPIPKEVQRVEAAVHWAMYQKGLTRGG